MTPAFRRALRILLIAVAVPPVACAPSAPPDQEFARGCFDRAQAGYEQAARQTPSALSPQLSLVRTLLRRDRWPEAVRAAEEAVRSHPNNADALGLLALADLRAGQPEKAAGAARRATIADKDSYWTLVASGRLALWNHHPGDARKALRRAADLRPREPDAWLGLLLADTDAPLPPGAAQKTAAETYLKLKPRGNPHDWMRENPDDLLPLGGAYGAAFRSDPPFRVATPNANKPITLPIEREGSVVLVPVTINGQPFRLLFDTGGGDRITLKEDAAQRLQLPTLARGTISGAQGTEPSRRLQAGRMQIGDLTFRAIPIQTVSDPGTAGDGILGAALLRAFRVRLDLRASTMTLTPTGAPATPAPPGALTLPFHDLHG